MAQPVYGETVKGQLFTVTHEILETERGIRVKEEIDVMRMETDPDIFHVPASILARVVYTKKKQNFFLDTIRLTMHDETLGIEREVAGDLNEDPFSKYMLEQLQKIRLHPHEVCVELHQQAIEEREKTLTAGTRLSWRR